MITFQCPACQKVLKVHDDSAGKKAPCPKCGQRLVVPPPVRNETVFVQPLPEPAAAPVPMRRCPYCAEDIRAEAIKCRHCGESLTGSAAKRADPQRSLRVANPFRVFGLLVKTVVTLICCAFVAFLCFSCSYGVSTHNNPTPGMIPVLEPTPDRIRLSQYQAIRDGMTYAEVVKVIGFKGEEMVSSRSEGIGLTITIVMWQNENGSNLSVTFQNGKVSMKAQAGLR